MWKLEDVSCRLKKKPVKELKNDLKPISLAHCMSNIPEEFVIAEYVKAATLSVLDPNQYGAVTKSCTALALLEIFHVWS